MLSTELRARQAKLESEQRNRLEKERQKLEKERLLKERARQRQVQREEEARLKRLAEEQARQKELEQQAELVEHNRGVYYSEKLQVVTVPDEFAQSKGIKRAADKVLLPPSAGSTLLHQDASKNGAQLFLIKTPFGTETCAGVLEFTAVEGTIALPTKVVRSLYGAHGEPRGTVEVQYRRLEKGSYVRLQPEARSFHEEVGGEMREALEAALHRCCTLSEGDWVQVRHGEQEYNLRVLELQPERHCSVIDTDVEADVGPSMETEEAIRQAEEEAARQEAYMQQLQAEMQAAAAKAAADAEEQRQQAEAREALAAAQRQQVMQEKAAALPPEVSTDHAGPVCSCVFRLPDGTRLSRRFELSAPVEQLFTYVDANGGGGLEPGAYRLVMQFPRRTLEASSSGTLADVGLGAGQEVFMLERMDS